MNTLFAETLKKLRKEKGLSQVQLGKQMFVNNSTVARWENGTRLPDAAMIARLSRVLDVDVSTLFTMAAKSDESPQHHHGGRQQSPPDRRPVRAGGGYAERHDHRLYLAAGGR